MAEGFVARGGKACGALRLIITHEEFGRSNLWRPDSFGLGGSQWVQAQPARRIVSISPLRYCMRLLDTQLLNML